MQRVEKRKCEDRQERKIDNNNKNQLQTMFIRYKCIAIEHFDSKRMPKSEQKNEKRKRGMIEKHGESNKNARSREQSTLTRVFR